MLTLPSLSQLLEVGDVEEYPYNRSFAEAKNDPIFVLHTSGSTGKRSLLVSSKAPADLFRDTEASHLHTRLGIKDVANV